MPKVISQEQKDKAKSLRKEGLSYHEIAEQTGISLRWCKQNLSQIEKQSEVLLQGLCMKSKTNHGVSKGEIANAFNVYDMPKQDGIKVMNARVKQIRAKDKQNNIVRPDWMVPDMAQYMTNKVIETSMILEDRCNEAAYELWCQLKGSGCAGKNLPSVLKIKHAMMRLATAACSTAPGSGNRLESWLNSLVKTANELSKRNPQTRVTVSNKIDSPDLSDLIDFIH